MPTNLTCPDCSEPSTAHVQVARTYGEPRSQPGEILQGFQAGGASSQPLWPEQQVDVTTRPAAPDPAAELVQVGQSEPVRVPNQHVVRARDVEAGFDDIGSQQQVVLAAGERIDLSSVSVFMRPWDLAAGQSAQHRPGSRGAR